MINQEEARKLFESVHKITLSERDIIIFNTAYGFGVMDAQESMKVNKGKE